MNSLVAETNSAGESLVERVFCKSRCIIPTLQNILTSFQTAQMTYTDQRILDSYKGLFEGLSASNKLELVESLSRSLKADLSDRDAQFYQSFGAFPSGGKDAERLVSEIKENRDKSLHSSYDPQITDHH